MSNAERMPTPVRRALTFFVSTIVLTKALELALLGPGPSAGVPPSRYWLCANVLRVVPGAVALAIVVAVRLPVRERLAIRLRPRLAWFVAWVLPVVLAVASVGLLNLVPGTTYQAAPESPLTSLPMAPMVSACIAALAGGIVTLLPTFAEELGFRGFLQRELEPLGFWTASLVTSLAWALWHLPVTLDTSKLVGSFPLHLLLLGPFLAVLQSKARSVLAPSLFHATLNGAAAIPALFVSGGSDIPRWLATHASTGVCLLLVLRITHLVRPETEPVTSS